MVAVRPIKLVVTNEVALRRLYGRKVSRVHSALENLRDADRRRGLDTRIVRIDVTRDMARYGARRVARHLDEKAVKDAIDAVWKALHPHYLLILGGPDVVPHQTMTKGLDTTDDKLVPSDLPYACDEPYSNDASTFHTPRRVVGRLPGITGDHSPAALLAAVGFATRWRPRALRHYDRPLAVSAKSWKAATSLFLQDAFGSARDLQLVPPKHFQWTQRLISRRAHYMNCHGVDQEGVFEGTDDDVHFPPAHESQYVARKIQEGTIAAAACCWGAQLYDPRRAGSKEPIINAYLRYGAYAYLGSSTRAWGDPYKSVHGDLLCQLFFRHVRKGVSAGRAVLEARREYIRLTRKIQKELGPVDYLTLAQFGLFGDPSVHPILPKGLSSPHTGRVPARVHGELVDRAVAQHAATSGEAPDGLAEPAVLRAAPRARVPKSIARVLRSEMEGAGGVAGKIKTFTLKPHGGPRGALAARPPSTDSVHVVSSEVGTDARGRPRRVLVVAHANGEKVVSLRVLHSKG